MGEDGRKSFQEIVEENRNARRPDWPPIKVENIDLEPGDGYIDICCDVTLKDAWRYPDNFPPGNWTAAWLFVKYQPTRVERKLTPEQVEELLRDNEGMADTQAKLALEAARKQMPTALDFAGPQDVAPVVLQSEQAVTAAAGSAGESERQVRHLELVPDVADEEGKQRFELRVPRSWRTAKLSPRSADHFVPPHGQIQAVEDGMGVFLFRAADNIGHGEVKFDNVRLRWVEVGEVDFPLEIWVHGLEMVHVPQGKFELGDPKGPDGPHKCFFARNPRKDADGETDWVYEITSERAIPVVKYEALAEADYADPPQLTWHVPPEDRDADPLVGHNSWGDVPEEFPKGYKAFYCMRRQATQGDYAAFINCLKGDQLTSRFPYGGQGDYRFHIYKLPNGQRIAIRPMRACNWLSWTDAMAFTWWAGLRPMTELEYEKACRGAAPAVPNEYSWGTTNLERSLVIVGDETDQAFVTGNAHLGSALTEQIGGDGGYGPHRDDAFELRTHANAELIYPSGRAKFFAAGSGGDRKLHRATRSYREASGSTYWGILGMTGNLWEYTVSASVAEGRRFVGEHGDGKLDRVALPKTEGPLSWPGTHAVGLGYRGGSWYTATPIGRLADRVHASGFAEYVFRSHDTGIRCVRTAPEHEKPPEQSQGSGPRRGFGLGVTRYRSTRLRS